MDQEALNEEHDNLDSDARKALEAGEFNADSPIEHDDDYDSYGRKVKKRIDKEVYKRKALETQLEETETEKQRIRRELKEAREKLSKYEEDETKSLETRVKDLQARRDKALDDGELTEYAKLNDELTDTKLDVVKRTTKRVQAPEPDPEPAKKTDDIAPAARAWLEKNADWLDEDPDKAAKAAKIEKALVREGYAYSDPDTYEELDRRLNGEAASEDDDLYDDNEPTPRAGATAGVVRDAGARNARQRPGTITRDDLARMKRAGFDPQSAEDRKGWMNRNKPL